jgi:hypothetical protein
MVGSRQQKCKRGKMVGSRQQKWQRGGKSGLEPVEMTKGWDERTRDCRNYREGKGRLEG